MIIIGGKHDTTPSEARPVWFHRQSSKSGASPVRPLTKRNKSKASAWIPLFIVLSLCLHHLHSDRHMNIYMCGFFEDIRFCVHCVYVCVLYFLVTLHVPLIKSYDKNRLLFLRYTRCFYDLSPHRKPTYRPLATISFCATINTECIFSVYTNQNHFLFIHQFKASIQIPTSSPWSIPTLNLLSCC